ncbi:hypothetical protein FA10DRAFT_77829 [Acaromyces ingoldii]|uniref:Uncharacterized protein n=1 Tax=Acaromyces ingoldii TaxID=215250 RepID=A0A316YQS8_9BASI|nr:hypothetical protein FA10DRAFT_77829 [Acaromyces ingoldii]PWN91900.1 hypothetical protein FA10DRAFT_77829 [Acaromyces ingoldii]
MHMRTRGAPIKFSKDQYNAPTWIFLQVPKTGSTHGDLAPGSQQQSVTQAGNQQREKPPARVCIPAKLCSQETENKRFLPLIQAIKANVEAPRNVAEAAKVLDTLERLDAGIFARERCSGLKQLLKIARVHGIDVCWQQFQGVITDIGLSEASMASLAPPHFPPRGVDLKF